MYWKRHVNQIMTVPTRIGDDASENESQVTSKGFQEKVCS